MDGSRGAIPLHAIKAFLDLHPTYEPQEFLEVIRSVDREVMAVAASIEQRRAGSRG